MKKKAFNFSLEQAYAFMGLTPEASKEDVAKAYRTLTKKYHPDLQGGDTEMMGKLNVARQTIESGGSATQPSSAPTEAYPEAMWKKYRQRFGPKPSGSYNWSDVEDMVEKAVGKGLIQVYTHDQVGYVPVDVLMTKHWRPFGSKRNTKRLSKRFTQEKLLQNLKRMIGSNRIFDLSVQPKEAWVTWEVDDGRRYQSVSFMAPKKRTKKAPGVGMKMAEAQAYLKKQGLAQVAGGSKYAYYGVPGSPVYGDFIRIAAKSIRLVRKRKSAGDWGIWNEVYFGKLTPQILDKMIAYVKSKA